MGISIGGYKLLNLQVIYYNVPLKHLPYGT
jgi:hypothetical protein